jgi:hypothetical protein
MHRPFRSSAPAEFGARHTSLYVFRKDLSGFCRNRSISNITRPRSWPEREGFQTFSNARGREMNVVIRFACVALLGGAFSGPAHADANAQEEMRGLDEQVQEIKSDVLGIATELSQLEERLLYPSNTQLAVFVSLSDADKFRLDAVRIQIDGALAAHHIYSFKELEALQSGGMQPIYTGNVTTGQHQIEVYVIGKLANGEDFKQTQEFTFSKEVKPRLLGVALAGPASDKAPIQLQNW